MNNQLQINEDDIKSLTKDIYATRNINVIIGKTNPFLGEKEFFLCILEQIIGLLHQEEKSDVRIIRQIQIALRACQSNNEYRKFSKFSEDNNIFTILKNNSLSLMERNFLKEIFESNYAEYEFKSDYTSCCYSAINAYCILKHNISNFVSRIDITVDIYDTVQNIKVEFSNVENKNIYIDWHSTNRINDIYMLYKTKYCGLDKESILDLVSADVVEEEYYLKDDRFTIAPSILMKQYLSIIEREVNEIIQLSNIDKKPDKHLNWYDMKNFVRKRGITIDYLSYKLSDVLDELYPFRNVLMHGEVGVTKEDYAILCEYKNKELFMGISIEKMKLKNEVIHPTVDELKNIM